nr:MAG TPA: hypothetical protein [Caudoviricetes sp.]
MDRWVKVFISVLRYHRTCTGFNRLCNSYK